MLTTNYSKNSSKSNSSGNMEIKSSTISNFFVQGLEMERLKKISNRKDAMLILAKQEKYKTISKKNSSNKNLKRIKLKDGRNFYDLNVEEYFYLDDLFELTFYEEENIILEYLSFIPRLTRLIVNYSQIYSADIISEEYLQQKNSFFKSLDYLDLSFNNLRNENLEIVKSIKSLRTLILSGNSLTSDIPNLSDLVNLEELDLSYNRIETDFYTDSENLIESEKGDKIVIEKTDINLKSKTGTNFFERSEAEGEDFGKNQERQDKSKSSKQSNTNLNQDNSYHSYHSLRSKYEKDYNKHKEDFEKWRKYFKTNLQKFFTNIGFLKNLVTLNLSNNQIKFIDLDPFEIVKEKMGFQNLKNLDISYNLIKESIALLLVMNLPKIENINITKNPILENKSAYETVEFNIFKNKNILLINKEKDSSIVNIGRKAVDLYAPRYLFKPIGLTSVKEIKKKVDKQLCDLNISKYLII